MVLSYFRPLPKSYLVHDFQFKISILTNYPLGNLNIENFDRGALLLWPDMTSEIPVEFQIEEEHEILDITTNKWIQQLMNHCTGYKNGFIRVNPSGYVFNAETRKYLQRLRKFEVRNDDIWICTFPKCGTTWTQEMVWCLMNNLDFETSKTVELDVRTVFIEHVSILDDTSSWYSADTIQKVADMPSPRIIKTHLPFDLLPDQIRTREKTPKLIHVFRNSRDVCVSHYHHWKILKGFNGSFDLWSELFLEGYGGYYSPYWKHVKSYYTSQYRNLLYLQYEDMKKDMKKTIEATCSFLGTENYTEDDKALLEQHLSFKNFQQTPTLNKQREVKLLDKMGWSNQDDGGAFVRKGIVGDWMNYFSNDKSEKFQQKDAELSNSTGLVIKSQI